NVIRAEVAAATRYDEVARSESRIGLDAVERYQPHGDRPATIATGNRFDLRATSFLEIVQRTVRVWRQQSNQRLVQWQRTHENRSGVDVQRQVVLPQRSVAWRKQSDASGVGLRYSRHWHRSLRTRAGNGGAGSERNGAKHHQPGEEPPADRQAAGSGASKPEIASASSSRPAPVCALNGMM